MRKSIALVLVAMFGVGLGGCEASEATARSLGCAPEDDECLAGANDGKSDSATATAKTVAQMNDLTTVWPLAKTAAEIDSGYLHATSSGDHGDLLPKSLYLPLFPDPPKVQGVGADVAMVYANLRVVAVRFDPCFAQIGAIKDSTACDNQIRVIFQSLSFDKTNNSTTAVDGAVHAFYRVSRDELVATVRDVIALRRAQGQTTSMGPLAAHPLIVKQGVAGDFSTKLGQLLLQHIGEENLIRFTHLSSGNLQTQWFFSGFDVASSDATPMDIAGLPKHTQNVSFFAGFAAPMAGGLSVATTTKDNIALLVNYTKGKAATATARKAAYDATLRIQNPGFHSPNTIDCASCHVAESAQKIIGEDQFDLSALADKNLFVADADFVSKKSASQTTSVRKQSGLNVHMLSYKLDALMIGARVVNETAGVLAYMNGTLLN